jgi:hypothetical protein
MAGIACGMELFKQGDLRIVSYQISAWYAHAQRTCSLDKSGFTSFFMYTPSPPFGIRLLKESGALWALACRMQHAGLVAVMGTGHFSSEGTRKGAEGQIREAGDGRGRRRIAWRRLRVKGAGLVHGSCREKLLVLHFSGRLLIGSDVRYESTGRKADTSQFIQFPTEDPGALQHHPAPFPESRPDYSRVYRLAGAVFLNS